MADRRRLPGWLTTTGWAVLGVAAAGLPVALATLAVLRVRSSGSVVAHAVLTVVLVLVAVGLVVALERGLSYAAREEGLGWAAGAAAGVAAVVLAGVFVPPLGTVLLGVALVVGFPALLAGVGYLAYWRWQHGPHPAPRTPASQDEVRTRAEQRRAAVRARHDLTREAVAQGLIGPGFTRGE